MRRITITLVILLFHVSAHCSEPVEKWDFFEIVLNGPSIGNPYKEVYLEASFNNGGSTYSIKGFYDGTGTYKIRFMPDTEGVWTYKTRSNAKDLHNNEGEFQCIAPGAENHGPVRVAHTYHFAYADGTPYKPFGTTCYVWTHQGKRLEEQTVETLASSPFNKIRMCLFPKNYTFSRNNPDFYPFQVDSKDNFSFGKFNPDYWANLEKRLLQLQKLGIEADLILFHPYDGGKWGFDRMPDEVDDFYLEYVVARLSAFRNVWWSLANEFDFMDSKTDDDWDRYGMFLSENDPYHHLLSNHNHPNREFDWSKGYITHVGLQHEDQVYASSLVKKFQKPVINDECQYEGNIMFNWGNISARELTHRFWLGAVNGIYTTHGETYMDPDDILWWSKGGVLKGESPDRIAFLRKIMDQGPPEGINQYAPNWPWSNKAAGDINSYLLIYFGVHQPSYWDFEFAKDAHYTIELINPWEMTVDPMEGVFSGKVRVKLPGKPYLALRVIKGEG